MQYLMTCQTREELKLRSCLLVQANSSRTYCLSAQELHNSICSVILEFVIFLDCKTDSNCVSSYKSTLSLPPL